MRAGFGTVMASAPSVDRVRTRKFLPLRSSSIDATVTGCLTKSSWSTGVSRTRSSAALLTGAASAARTLDNAGAATAPAADRRNKRRDLFMAPNLQNGYFFFRGVVHRYRVWTRSLVLSS